MDEEEEDYLVALHVAEFDILSVEDNTIQGGFDLRMLNANHAGSRISRQKDLAKILVVQSGTSRKILDVLVHLKV